MADMDTKAARKEGLKISVDDKKNEDLKEEEKDYENVDNWYELRLKGKLPERRGHHSCFIHK